jgi:predicted phosphodiesterase
MSLYAVLADIHGNYDALQAVVEDALQVSREEGDGCVRFVFLGDAVDTGPQPQECLDWVCANALAVVHGNHDRAVARAYDTHPPGGVHAYWLPTVIWTRRVLGGASRLREWPGLWEAPSELPTFTLMHGGLVDPDMYLTGRDQAHESMAGLRTRYGVYGHTHYQACWFEHGGGIGMGVPGLDGGHRGAEEDLVGVPLGSWFPLPADGLGALLNPGSVGLVRHNPELARSGIGFKPHAAYALLRNSDGEGIEAQFRHVDYDIEETIRRLRDVRWPADDSSSSVAAAIDLLRRGVASHIGRGLSFPHTGWHSRVSAQVSERPSTLTGVLQDLIETSIIPSLRSGKMVMPD